MKSTVYLLIFLIFALKGIECPNPHFREATMQDLNELLILDRKITYEHFKPIFLLYTDRSLGQETDKMLEDELAADEALFTKAFLGAIPNKLYVICLHNKIIGFSYIYPTSQSLTVDLLFIEKEYRQQGIGKKFFQYIFTQAHSTHCRVAILTKNLSALQFWESLGFEQCAKKPEDMGNEFPEDCKDCYIYYEYRQPQL